jgi:hypothetical protein
MIEIKILSMKAVELCVVGGHFYNTFFLTLTVFSRFMSYSSPCILTQIIGMYEALAFRIHHTAIFVRVSF